MPTHWPPWIGEAGARLADGTPLIDLHVVLSGADKVRYSSSDCMASVDTDYSTIEQGGKSVFTVGIDAPAAAITGGLIFVEPSFSLDRDERAFWIVP